MNGEDGYDKLHCTVFAASPECRRESGTLLSIKSSGGSSVSSGCPSYRTMGTFKVRSGECAPTRLEAIVLMINRTV